MLIAHLVPGYFNGIISQPKWEQNWTQNQQILLWTFAFTGTFVPDIDVIFNILFHGVFNHSTLLTHSLFPVLIFIMIWSICKYVLHRDYFAEIWKLLAISWLSHIILDALVHKTPLLYPLSSEIIGYAPYRVYVGGIWYYLTDPIFLLELLLIAMGVGHWLYQRVTNKTTQRIFLSSFIIGYVFLAIVFVSILPYLQSLLPSL